MTFSAEIRTGFLINFSVLPIFHIRLALPQQTICDFDPQQQIEIYVESEGNEMTQITHEMNRDLTFQIQKWEKAFWYAWEEPNLLLQAKITEAGVHVSVALLQEENKINFKHCEISKRSDSLDTKTQRWPETINKEELYMKWNCEVVQRRDKGGLWQFSRLRLEAQQILDESFASGTFCGAETKPVSSHHLEVD